MDGQNCLFKCSGHCRSSTGRFGMRAHRRDDLPPATSQPRAEAAPIGSPVTQRQTTADQKVHHPVRLSGTPPEFLLRETKQHKQQQTKHTTNQSTTSPRHSSTRRGHSPHQAIVSPTTKKRMPCSRLQATASTSPAPQAPPQPSNPTWKKSPRWSSTTWISMPS